MNRICKHLDTIRKNVINKFESCEECEKDKTFWVALRQCLTCGHVGCCDSSIGLHATKHFKETGHPIMTSYPDKSWKWCYIDKHYL